MERKDWHTMGVQETTERLRTSMEGLSEKGAKDRLDEYGYNEVKEKKRMTWPVILARQFKNFLIILLVIAAIVSFAIGRMTDGAAISFAILLSIFFGFFQEYKAEEALEALEGYISPKAIVIRGGNEVEVETKYIVPGDVVLFREGEMVPADSRIVESINLGLDQSSLTGESYAITKSPEPVDKGAALADRKNIAYMGTTAVRGHGKGIVFSTGYGTEFGKIAKNIVEAPERATPLQLGLDRLGKKIGMVAIVLCVIFFLFGIFSGIQHEQMFIIAVALAVAAVPEGLPTITTMSLAIGTQRMAKENAIVRRLSAIETLGSTTVICTDKTGTLTQNRITVRRVCLLDASFSIKGGGRKLKGKITTGEGKKPSKKEKELLEKAILIGVLCNNAILEKKGERALIHGSPMEGALLIAGEKAGISVEERKKRKLIAEIPFDTKRKMMTCVREVGGKRIAFVKGAPESVLSLCTTILTGKGEAPLTKGIKKKIVSMEDGLAENAMRIIAVAYRKVPKEGKYTIKNTERSLVFVGLVGMLDPPRPEVKDAIASCKKAGINVVMITGDNQQTAVAIGKELGLLEKEEEAISGSAVARMSDKKFRSIAKKIKVYSRVTPECKFKIVKLLMGMDEVVAVTGDGVNDAPAIKKADIGTAMGSGTDVSKGVSDMVLVDDNFATIAKAVEYGRNIYDNICNFVRYQLSTNVGAIMVMFGAPLFGFPLPLTAVQILWINIIMDGPPALALGAEPPSHTEMGRPPRPPKQAMLTREMLSNIAFNGFTMAFGSLFLFLIGLSVGFPMDKAMTVTFTAFVLFQLFNALNCRSPTRSAFKDFFSNKYLLLAILLSLILQLSIIYTPFLQGIFSTMPLTWGDWLLIFLISSSILITNEIRKHFFVQKPIGG